MLSKIIRYALVPILLGVVSKIVYDVLFAGVKVTQLVSNATAAWPVLRVGLYWGAVFVIYTFARWLLEVRPLRRELRNANERLSQEDAAQHLAQDQQQERLEEKKPSSVPRPTAPSVRLLFNHYAALVLAADETVNSDGIARETLLSAMRRSGVTSDLEAHLGVDHVLRLGLIEPVPNYVLPKDVTGCYRPTEEGKTWLTEHQDQIGRVHENQFRDVS